MSEEQPLPHFGYLQKGTLSRKEEQVPDIGTGPIWRTAKNGMEFFKAVINPEYHFNKRYIRTCRYYF
jgi:hypothetical protein